MAEPRGDYATGGPPVLAAIPIIESAAADTSGGELVIEEAEAGEPYLIHADARLLRVHGASMEPLASDGQYVLLSSPDRSARSGDLVVIRSKSRGLLFKRLYINGTKQSVLYVLQSANPLDRLEPVILPESDVEQLRVVIGVIYE